MPIPFDSTSWSKAKRTPGNEIAWKMSDIFAVLRNALLSDAVVLGGDILNGDMSYTLDNWCYFPKESVSARENALLSYEYAIGYIDNYIAIFGDNYYVVLVIQ